MGADVNNKGEELIVERDEIAQLLSSERWGCDMSQVEDTLRDNANPSLRAELAELLLRPDVEPKFVDIEKLTEISSEDIIERFLQKENLRIAVDEGADIKDVIISAELDEEDDMVSEELAEVYLGQGLNDEAKEIYRKLSLLNPEKSIYFAKLIAKIESNN